MSVTIQVTVTSSWTGGFGCTLSITNNNNYPINTYSLSLGSTASSITWSSHFIASPAVNGVVTLTKQPGVGSLAPNATFTDTFGGTGVPPTASQFTFNQIDPPLNPVDPNIRGNFGQTNYTHYVDILAYPEIDLVSIAKNTVHLFYTFDFIVSNQSK